MPQAWPFLVPLVAAASVRARRGVALGRRRLGRRDAREGRAARELLAALEAQPGRRPGLPDGARRDAPRPRPRRPRRVLRASTCRSSCSPSSRRPAPRRAAWIADPLSGLVLVIVLPLIPVFMALIGMATAGRAAQAVGQPASLSRGFLEVVGGLSTLMIFGRAERQAARIRAVTDDYRSQHHEGAADHLPLGVHARVRGEPLGRARRRVDRAPARRRRHARWSPGLFVLVLAPEVFLPLRNVGAAFHASSAGVAASADAFDLLDGGAGGRHRRVEREARRSGARADRRRAMGERRRPRHPVRVTGSSSSTSGCIGALASCSTASTSTRAAGVRRRHRRERLGQVEPARGAARLRRRGRRASTARRRAAATPGDRSLDRMGRPVSGRSSRGTIASNVRLGDADAAPELSRARCASPGSSSPPSASSDPAGRASRAARRSASPPPGRSTACWRGTPGCCSSTSRAPRQDAAREAALGDALRELAADGRIVLVTTHRAGLARRADRVIELEAAHA